MRLSCTNKREFRNILNFLKTKSRTNLQNERIVIKRCWGGEGSSYESRAINHYLKTQVGQLRAGGLAGDFVVKELRKWKRDFKAQKRRSHFYQGLLGVLSNVNLHWLQTGCGILWRKQRNGPGERNQSLQSGACLKFIFPLNYSFFWISHRKLF